MATITTLVGSDGITTANSMTKINANFSNLNSDKVETSVISTDSTFASASDAKVASQLATKLYVDSGGNQNASETTRGIVEEATDAEVTAGSSTGSTGAKLFITPTKLLTGLPNSSETVRGVVEEATDAEVTAGTATGSTGAKLFVTPAKLATRYGSYFKFGGTGADGALAITTGTTTIDLAGVQLLEKNYSSISITGDGKLAFSNPHANGTTIIIKCSGNMTLTSSAAPMIDARNCGAVGGAAGTRSSAGNADGTTGTAGYSYGDITTNGGVSGKYNAVGAGGAVGGFVLWGGITAVLKQFYGKYPKIAVGAGGGGAGCSFDTGSGSLTGGAGGNGGGVLIIECAGTLNFTTTGGISASGSVGGNGVRVTASGAAGGGGGGGGGTAIVLYNIAGTVTGTVVSAGGVGGNMANNSTYAGYGGGGGGSLLAAGSNGATSTTDGAKTGADGAAGLVLFELNTSFA
jgi:hypothetical protein